MSDMSAIHENDAALGPLIGIAASASVRTPCGARRAENVRPGDLIVTRDNGLKAVKMIWTRTVTATDIAADPALAPIRLKPRAIGPMMPQRDLLLAAEHRLLVPGYRLADFPDDRSYLIPARAIAEVSDNAFFDRTPRDITFYNIVFEEHQVFAADGLPVESYLPNPATIGQLDQTVSRDLAELFRPRAEARPSYPAPRYAEPEIEDYRPDLV